MSDQGAPEPGQTVTVASRMGSIMRAGGLRGLIPPVVTMLLAFVVGGLFVLVTGNDPIRVYQEIFTGTGVTWFFGGLDEAEAATAEAALQQTLLLTTVLILVGLAVAIAFRCGLFNIGGQGQYAVGAMASVFIATRLDALPGVLHIVVAILAAMAAGAVWAGIAGVLRARTGANEVISTIMLNYTAVALALYLFGVGGPLQDGEQPSVPVSPRIADDTRLPVFWGAEELQGAHVGLFIALAGAAFAWWLLNRSVSGYEMKATGLNPDAAEYGGIDTGRQQIKAMAICGTLAGLAGAMDVLGWQYSVAPGDIQVSQVGFLGIAVALLGRNTAIGTVFAALLFAALSTGTNPRSFDPEVFPPELASNLSLIIQGLIVLLVSAPAIASRMLGWRVRMAGGRK
jgi:general nucleoside transport system permease protein